MTRRSDGDFSPRPVAASDCIDTPRAATGAESGWRSNIASIPPPTGHGTEHDSSRRKGYDHSTVVNRHRPRAKRQDVAALRYLAQWRHRVESIERSVQYGPKPRPPLDNRVSIGAHLTGCPRCDVRLLGDGPRDRLEGLMHRDGRRAHGLRAAVTRLDERYRVGTSESRLQPPYRGGTGVYPWRDSVLRLPVSDHDRSRRRLPTWPAPGRPPPQSTRNSWACAARANASLASSPHWLTGSLPSPASGWTSSQRCASVSPDRQVFPTYRTRKDPMTDPLRQRGTEHLMASPTEPSTRPCASPPSTVRSSSAPSGIGRRRRHARRIVRRGRHHRPYSPHPHLPDRRPVPNEPVAPHGTGPRSCLGCQPNARGLFQTSRTCPA
ncbi:hypothetical protein Rruber_05587 (plasmid) [Rhodococcus ruber]